MGYRKMRYLFPLIFSSYLLFASRVVIVSLPGVNLDDLLSLGGKNFLSLAEKGAIGLVSPRLPPNFPLESAYLAMGTGRRLVASEEARLCLAPQEMLGGIRSSALYEKRWGGKPPNALLHIGLPSLANINSSLKGKKAWNTLGDILQKRGIRTFLLGNGDSLQEIHREASCVLVSSQGTIDGGCVGKELTIEDPLFPGGLRTNFPLLRRLIPKFLPDRGVLLIEIGDSLRIESQYPYMNEAMRSFYLRYTLQETMNLIEYLLPLLKPTDLFIFISPFSGRYWFSKGDRLSPLLIMGKGYKGLLSSKSTRVKGVISLYDFAPTILSYYGITEHFYQGRKVYSEKGNLKDLWELHQRSLREWQTRKKTKWFVGLSPILLSLIFALSFLYPASAYASLLLLLFPFSLLLLSPLPLGLPYFPLLIPAIMSIAFLSLLPTRKRAPFYTSLFLVLLIGLDVLQGGKWMSISGIGHSIQEGARYYGIGNEFMGLFIGSLLVIYFYWSHFKGYYFLFPLACLLVGAPWWGANWGGFLTSVICFFYLLASPIKKKKNIYIFIGIFFLLIFLLPLFADILGKSTHIGLAFGELARGKISDILPLVQRKVLTNLKLLQRSDWSALLGVELSLLFLSYILHYRLNRDDVEMRWLKGVMWGTMIALLFNDSGVVASALLLLPVVSTILINQAPWNFSFNRSRLRIP